MAYVSPAANGAFPSLRRHLAAGTPTHGPLSAIGLTAAAARFGRRATGSTTADRSFRSITDLSYGRCRG